ncbi:MAG TPA: GTPase Era [Acidimicrobiales bacterium]|jgi:GTP-binding protein Era|nr:GTPase Era [Acidimicrobiales bacterium]
MDEGMQSGFASIIGRPNVGKSTLVNAMVGSKVSITSSRPNTTRHSIRGILHRPGVQVVFVDTPGLHRPRTALGERLNDTAVASLNDLDVVVALVDATAAVGPGDRFVLSRALEATRGHTQEEEPDGEQLGMLVAVNKIDRARPEEIVTALASVAETVDRLVAEGVGGAGTVPEIEFFPVSATTGKGVDALVDAIVTHLPEGPPYYPEDMVTDTPEAQRVAELVREQLLRRAREELPHAIACRVTEWEWPRIRVEILVERDSQKAIVIGRGGEVLKAVGTAVRQELPPGAYLELFVRVEKRWQQRDDALDRLGY